MKVFIVSRGENCEGGGIIGVYKDKEEAEKHMIKEKQEDNFLGCDWCEVEEWDVK